MAAKNALLIVTNPTQIHKILPSIRSQIENTLYIHLLSALSEPFGNFHTNIFTSWPKYSQLVHAIYSQAVIHCQNLDVRVLLSGLKYRQPTIIKTNRAIDLIIFDKNHDKDEATSFVKNVVQTATKYEVITVDSGKFENLQVADNCNDKVCNHTVLGGTFDRIHIAHKLLLSEAVLRATSTVTVGVTEVNMLRSKTLWELIEPLEKRLYNVRDFLTDVCPELAYCVVPISDPFGPAITDPTMQLIVVSEETLRGGNKINEIRVSKELNLLEVVPIKLIDEPEPGKNEELKISSSTTRIRLLGTLLKPLVPKNIPNKPYVIGLTGGVASGKSGVAKWMCQLGAQVIDCDKIAHQVYLPGKPCHAKLVETFGQQILGDNNIINRQVLGSIVFNNRDEMNKLNALVWPHLGEEVDEIVSQSHSQVIVVEAAVLLMSGRDKKCHEVWTTFIPREEAIKRLQIRNGLSEDQAIARLNNQPANSVYVEAANVVLCSLWETEFTRKQVDKAWELLQKRIL